MKNENSMLFSNIGKAYGLKIPGENSKSELNLAPGEEIVATVSSSDADSDKCILLATNQGTLKKTAVKEFANAKTLGIIAIKLDKGESLVAAMLTGGKDELMLVSKGGKVLRTSGEALRVMGRASHGVRGMKLGKDDTLLTVLPVKKGASMLFVSKNGIGKRCAFDTFSPHGRGTSGQRAYGVNERTGALAAAVSVRDDDEVILLTSENKSIPLIAKDVPVYGASASGVHVGKIANSDFVIGLDGGNT
ncbi:MAG: hypothetical protein LBM77_05350 [Spirochaetaceae bacterium]|jgi:DNA gyrase subunit A|nr:hypothetical protein [Spirochaetaceae bacterium]